MICENALLKEAENGCWDIDISELKQILEHVPKEEIVRCKDCKYKDEKIHTCTNVMFRGERIHIWVKPDDFCSYGERRTDG